MKVYEAQVPKINIYTNKHIRCNTTCRKNYKGEIHETSQWGDNYWLPRDSNFVWKSVILHVQTGTHSVVKKLSQELDNTITFLSHDELFLKNRYKIIINRNQVVNTNSSMLTNNYFYFLNFKSTNNICEQYELSVAYKFNSSASAGEIPISRISTRAFKSSFFRWRSTITELRNSIWAWASSFSSNNLWCMGSVKKFTSV